MTTLVAEDYIQIQPQPPKPTGSFWVFMLGHSPNRSIGDWHMTHDQILTVETQEKDLMSNYIEVICTQIGENFNSWDTVKG